MPYDFSVIVPTYARPAQLSECLEALWRLAYPRQRFEVIVVDDGTPAPLQEVPRPSGPGPDLRWVYKPNGGPGSARNAGAAIARGRFLAFTDDDCRPEPGWLQGLLEMLEQEPDCIVGGKTLNDLPRNRFSEASQLIVDLVYAHYNADPEHSRFFASNNMAAPADLFRELGGFEEICFRDASEDRELCDRWRHRGHRLRFAGQARIAHGHHLNLHRFCRQHFAYGRGASHYHRTRALRGSGRMHQEMTFHARLPRLLRRELKQRGLRRSIDLAPLLALWQLANAAGFAHERFRSLRKRRTPRDRLGFDHKGYGATAGPVTLRTCETSGGAHLPLVAEPIVAGHDLVTWARSNRALIERQVRAQGAVLLRDFSVPTPEHLEQLIDVLYGSTMEYRDRAVPRTRVTGNIYTATDYSSEHEIFLHNESSFAHTWPLRLFLHCRRPASRGGETRIADIRRVFGRIDPEIRQRFATEGVLYRRNFRPGPFGLSWQEGFQLSDATELEAYCRSAQIDFEWVNDDHLRTTERRPAVARHPETGESVWFNHACVLNVGTLDTRRGRMLRRLFREEDLPNNSYYGDGTPIEPQVLEMIRNAYLAETVLVDWQAGDVLLVDNMLVAHGRGTYSGPRQMVVGMAQPTDWKSIEGAAWE